MIEIFEFPNVEDSSVLCELRGREVVVSGSAEGLKSLSLIFHKLSEKVSSDSPQHVHLEDCGILLSNSLRLTIVGYLDIEKLLSE